jgi:hypothetical protein
LAREVTTTSERFEEMLFDVLSGEIEPEPSGTHLGDRELRRLMCGRARLSEFERSGVHLARCAVCRARLDDLRRAEESSRWRHASNLTRATVQRFHTRPGIGLAVLRHVGVVAVVLSIVAISMALGDRTGTEDSAAPVKSLARGTASPAAGTASILSDKLDPQGLVRALHAFDEYPPHRAAAYTIGLLRQVGVPLSSAAMAFDAATIYVAESGDTWETVAVKTLGDGALWPMVVLLNLELTTDGEFVPPGTYLRVPKTIPLGGAK